MSTSKAWQFRPSLWNLVFSLTLAVAVILNTGVYISKQLGDRCDSMLNQGWWLDESQSKWQPAGCTMNTFKSSDLSSCLDHGRILFIGDSVVRTQFYSLTTLVDPEYDNFYIMHEDISLSSPDGRMNIDFWWDPFLNTSRTLSVLAGKAQPQQRYNVIVIGVGLWHMRYLEDNYFEEWKMAVNQVFDAVEQPMGIADAVLLSPIEDPDYNMLSPDRLETMTSEKVALMNSFLRKRAKEKPAKVRFGVPFVWNDIKAGVDNSSIDGLHFFGKVSQAQAQITLNFYCNHQPIMKYPITGTCCALYPPPHWFQQLFFFGMFAVLPIGLIYVTAFSSASSKLNHYIPSLQVLIAMLTFGLCLVYMYIGDRSHIFGKLSKSFDTFEFSVMVGLVIFAGLASVKHENEGDQGFLNRDQTDEWKGWMQAAILVYHFTGASRISGIYNPIRALVAAYLFQTGYGHFTYFYKKRDFSFARILSVLVRLNLLTCVLQYVMNTDYLAYYFAPLVSFWFIVIHLTMFIGSSYNKTTWILLGKIVFASMITSIVIKHPGILETLFDALELFFNIHWNAPEWRFRLALDAWIVYIGMLCAFLYIKISEHKMHCHPHWELCKRGAIGIAGLAMGWYFWFELLCEDKFAYNQYHPYISWIPVLSFVVLRNATLRLRNSHSKLFAFLGRISLETFIGQYHMWLANDTTSLLIVVINPLWVKSQLGWWINLALSTVIFIFLSYQLSESTGTLTQWLCPRPRSKPSNLDNYRAVPLLPTSASSTPNTTTSPLTMEEEELKPHTNDNTIDSPMRDIEEDSSWSRVSNCTANIWQDKRIRIVMCLIVAGLINRWC